MSEPYLAKDRLNHAIQALAVGTTQTAAYTGTAGVISNVVGSTVARIYCTTDAFIAVGTSPTATTSGMPVKAGVAEYIRINPAHKVSAIQASSGGNLHVTGME